jgi:urease accessory protein
MSVIGSARSWGEDNTLQALAYWGAAGMVQALVRLVPLGQSAGQRILHQLQPVSQKAMACAREMALEDMGSMMPLWDIAAMRHQALYSRLYRS